ncbi:MAG: DUF2225 domain-containing protein [Lachnospiraceae bacterium]
MGILAGLEKFGFKTAEKLDLFGEEKKKEQTQVKEKAPTEIPKEEDFLLDKVIQCPICDKKFKSKMVKSGRAKRLQPDEDLRPRFQYIDTMKYGVTVCPHCGYAALDNQFEHITSGQRKLVRENVCSQFKSDLSHQEDIVYDYPTAIDRFELALLNAVVKKGKTSEKAYICLKLAWLYRGYVEELEAAEKKDEKRLAESKKHEEEFYQEAYDGFLKAISTESFPMCGMPQSTVDYLLAYMSYHFGKYEVCSRFIASIVQSTTVSQKMKDKTLELKEKVMEKLKDKK